MVSLYPDDIAAFSCSPAFCGVLTDANASAKAASFVCGSFIQFSLLIDSATKTIREARYTTNGCGYVIAAAECVAKGAIGIKLTDLGGADELIRSATAKLNTISEGRRHCLNTVAESFRSALADYRKWMIEEFSGEKALICTCFGVSEDTILVLIEKTRARTVAAVSAACNAGAGCGSCQVLIQELIDSEVNRR